MEGGKVRLPSGRRFGVTIDPSLPPEGNAPDFDLIRLDRRSVNRGPARSGSSQDGIHQRLGHRAQRLGDRFVGQDIVEVEPGSSATESALRSPLAIRTVSVSTSAAWAWVEVGEAFDQDDRFVHENAATGRPVERVLESRPGTPWMYSGLEISTASRSGGAGSEKCSTGSGGSIPSTVEIGIEMRKLARLMSRARSRPPPEPAGRRLEAGSH